MILPVLGNDHSHYDPATGRIYLGPKATVYEGYHEKAHKIQHARQCMPWRVWARCNGIRLIQYFAWAWVEYDAMTRALHAMEWHGVWNLAASNEASTKFMTYIKGRSN